MKTRFWNEEGNISFEIDMVPIQNILHALFESWVEQGFHERDFVEAVVHASQLELFDYYVQRDLTAINADDLPPFDGVGEYEPELPIFTIEEFRENVINGLFNDEDGFAMICEDGNLDGEKISCQEIIDGNYPESAKFVTWYGK